MNWFSETKICLKILLNISHFHKYTKLTRIKQNNFCSTCLWNPPATCLHWALSRFLLVSILFTLQHLLDHTCTQDTWLIFFIFRRWHNRIFGTSRSCICNFFCSVCYPTDLIINAYILSSKYFHPFRRQYSVKKPKFCHSILQETIWLQGSPPVIL